MVTIISYFKAKGAIGQLDTAGTESINSAIGDIVRGKFCVAVTAILSDGLKSHKSLIAKKIHLWDLFEFANDYYTSNKHNLQHN